MTDVDLMTQKDYDELRAEIERLESVERTEIAERIRIAREWGDLKENSEYHDAKNSQSMLETKILRLRERLLRAQIHTGETGGDTVGFGSRVTVVDESSGRELHLHAGRQSQRRRGGREALDRLAGRPVADRRARRRRRLGEHAEGRPQARGHRRRLSGPGGEHRGGDPKLKRVTSDEIRERFLSFFEERDHKRLPSASLVPPHTTRRCCSPSAGMHPLKPYFQGDEKPPHHRLTTCQKCFRTVDIDNVGSTTGT